MEENKFLHAPIDHRTYHHFTNNGKSDSNIDVIMYPEVTSDGTPSDVIESVTKLLCSKTNTFVDSSHDVLITTFLLPVQTQLDQVTDNIMAPKIQLSRHNIHWTEEGIEDYKDLLSSSLPVLNSEYFDVTASEPASVLFQVTNHMLSEAAKGTNKYTELGKAPKAKKPFVPPEIKAAVKQKEKALKNLNTIQADTSTTDLENESATATFIRTLLGNTMFH